MAEVQGIYTPQCHNLAKQLSHYLYFFLFYFNLDLLHKEEVQESVTWQISHITVTHQDITRSHDECGKIHRPYSSYISSVQEIDKNSIEFFLSTQTWSRLKLSWLESYIQYMLQMHLLH